MPTEIRFRTPIYFKKEVDKLKEFFPEMSLDNIYFIVFEYGYSRIVQELLKGDKISKVEYLPHKQIKKLTFCKEVK